jgi:hypothetical protein
VLKYNRERKELCQHHLIGTPVVLGQEIDFGAPVVLGQEIDFASVGDPIADGICTRALLGNDELA